MVCSIHRLVRLLRRRIGESDDWNKNEHGRRIGEEEEVE